MLVIAATYFQRNEQVFLGDMCIHWYSEPYHRRAVPFHAAVAVLFDEDAMFDFAYRNCLFIVISPASY